MEDNNIVKETIIEEYINKGKTRDEVRKILGVGVATFNRYFKKYNIPARKAGRRWK